MASKTWLSLFVVLSTLHDSVASPCKPVPTVSQSVVTTTSASLFETAPTNTASVDSIIQTTGTTALENLHTTEASTKENESIWTEASSAETFSAPDTTVTEAAPPTISTTTFIEGSSTPTNEGVTSTTERISSVVIQTSSDTIGALTSSTEILSTTADTTTTGTEATSEPTTTDTTEATTEAASAEPTTAMTESMSNAATEDTTVTTTVATTGTTTEFITEATTEDTTKTSTQPTSEASTVCTTTATTEITTRETTTATTEDTTEATTAEATIVTTGTTTEDTTEAAITTTEAISSTTESIPTTTSVEIPVETIVIQNGGFEDSTIHWDYYGSNAHTFLTSNPHYEGTYSYAMGSTYGGEVGVTQTLDKSLLRANTPYKLSIYATTSSQIGCPGGIRIVVDTDRREETFGRYVSEFASAELAAGWRYISGDFTITEDALADNEPIKVIVNTLCAPGGNYVFIDNVELVG